MNRRSFLNIPSPRPSFAQYEDNSFSAMIVSSKSDKTRLALPSYSPGLWCGAMPKFTQLEYPRFPRARPCTPSFVL